MNKIKIILNMLNIKKVFLGKNGGNTYLSFTCKINELGSVEMNDGSSIFNNTSINIDEGKLKIDKNSYINSYTNIVIKKGVLSLGENSFINNNCEVICLGDIIIGKNVLIGPRCNIISGNHNFNDLKTEINKQGFSTSKIIIEDNTWIGCNATILSGVTIGKGSIIAASSVVTKNVGENEIWGGNPAKLIKYRGD